jgi:hypothetical protein
MPNEPLAKSDLELRKLEMENRKLELELALETKPWWKKSSVWISYASAIVGVAVGVYQFFKSDIEFQRAELKKEQAEKQLAEAAESKQALDKEIAALAEAKEALENENEKLSGVATELAKILKSNTKLRELLQSQTLDATLRSVLYPLQARLNPRGYPKGGNINKREIRVVIDKSGNGTISVEFGGLGKSSGNLPSFKFVVLALGSTNVLQEFEFPPLKVEQRSGGVFSTFQASGKHAFTIDASVLSQLLVPSQLTAK